MTKPTYRSLNMQATLLGVDRRLCISILLVAFLAFRHLSFTAAILVFASLWGGAYWLAKHDPELVVIFPKALLQRRIYDPGKFSNKTKGGDPY